MSDIVLKNPLKESKNSFVYLIKIDDYKCSEGHWQADPTSSMYGIFLLDAKMFPTGADFIL